MHNIEQLTFFAKIYLKRVMKEYDCDITNVIEKAFKLQPNINVRALLKKAATELFLEDES